MTADPLEGCECQKYKRDTRNRQIWNRRSDDDKQG